MVAQVKPTYTVRAQRDGRWWVLTTPDVPGAVSQVHGLSQADAYIRESIAFVLGVDAGSFDVSVVPDLPAGLSDKTREVREHIAALDAQQRAVAAASRAVVAELKAKGLSQQDIATVMGVSAQRVSQLARQAS